MRWKNLPRMEPLSGVSEYEQLRLQNIARNEQFLEQIGIENRKNKTDSSKITSKRKRAKETENERVDNIQPVRRSSRVAVLGPVSYVEVVFIFIFKNSKLLLCICRLQQCITNFCLLWCLSRLRCPLKESGVRLALKIVMLERVYISQMVVLTLCMVIWWLE